MIPLLGQRLEAQGIRVTIAGSFCPGIKGPVPLADYISKPTIGRRVADASGDGVESASGGFRSVRSRMDQVTMRAAVVSVPMRLVSLSPLPSGNGILAVLCRVGDGPAQTVEPLDVVVYNKLERGDRCHFAR